MVFNRGTGLVLRGYSSIRGLNIKGKNVRGMNIEGQSVRRLSVLVSRTVDGCRSFELPAQAAEEVHYTVTSVYHTVTS